MFYRLEDKMMRITIVVLLCLALAVNCQVANKQKPRKKFLSCNANNIKKAKCAFGKNGNGCIPKVRKINYDQYDVKPTWFKITWDAVASAKCYYLELFTGSTGIVYKTRSCIRGNTYKMTGLEPWTVYEVQLSVVNRACRRGRPSPPVRIKTYWAPTEPTTRAPRPTYSPTAGRCGAGYFTCRSKKKQCIPSKKWCDRKIQCDDGSDERRCPGGCPELDLKFKNGNFSCSRWGSPGSYCFFDCDPFYVRDGKRYTSCSRQSKRWTNPIPTCRLKYTRILKVLPEETTSTSVTLQWEPVGEAIQYSFQAIEQLSIDHTDMEFVKTEIVNATECCKTTITGLKPGVEYRASMWAMDRDGERGMESLPVYFKSVAPPTIHIKSG
ncbi:uncharacterized protein LOC120348670 [Styela clava]